MSKTITDRFADLAEEFGNEEKLSMINFTMVNGVQCRVEKCDKLKSMINEACNELAYQIYEELKQMEIQSVNNIGFSSHSEFVVFTKEDASEDQQTYLSFEPDVWVSKN